MFDNSVMNRCATEESSLQKKLSSTSLLGFRYNNMPYLTVLVLAVSIILCTSFNSLANNVTHVNVGRISVNDQSLSNQNEAGKLALAQVFIKMSGNINVIDEPEISKAIDNYEQFLISSSFIEQEDELLLEATFSQQKVENLLLASGLSVWTSLRPSAVVWIARENDQLEKVVVSEFADDVNSQKIVAKAFTRGVEIVVPSGDLDDALNVSVYDVWNQYITKLQEQSVRYNIDFLISATVQSIAEESATHKLDFIITQVDPKASTNVETGRIFGSSEEAVLLSLVDMYANMLAKQFSSITHQQADEQTVKVRFSGIDSIEDYVNMIDVVSSVPSVSDVTLIKQFSDQAIIEIVQKLSIAQLKSILVIDSRIKSEQIEILNADDTAVSFRWQEQ